MEISLLENPHFIDCGVPPSNPGEGAILVRHEASGVWKFNLSQVELYQPIKPGKTMKTRKLFKLLKRRHTFNANVCDYLISHPELIPDEWKEDKIHFAGTWYDIKTTVRFCDTETRENYNRDLWISHIKGLYWDDEVNRWKTFWRAIDFADSWWYCNDLFLCSKPDFSA